MQKWLFLGGLLGMLIMVIIMLTVSKNTFISSFNDETAKLFGFKDAYAGTLKDVGSSAVGYTPSPFGITGSFGQSMLLVPMLMFYLLWPNWGTTLYGEIRGASDFKRVFSGMFFGLWTTVLLSVILLALFAKFFGFDFYQDVNALWIDNAFGIASPHALPIFPYPVMLVGWAVHNQAFHSSFNDETAKLFGFKDAYAGTLKDVGSSAVGYTPSPFGITGSFGQSMLLVPMLMFYLLWPNWGTTLYGEIRGASDFKRVFSGMFFGLWTTVLLSVILLALFAKFFGFDFYQDVNALWIDNAFGIASPHALPIFPYPVMLVGWAVHNQAFQVILILLMSLWFFAWVGTLFLSSTRVIFAAAFDRILPDGAAQVSEKRRVPVWSLVLMLLPAVGLAALYSYNSTFHTYTLDATLVIAVTYLFSAIAVVILPWRKPDLWAASPASRLKVAGVPIVPVAGVITIGLIGYCLYEWLSSSAYGVNNNDSLIYMGAMYVLALVIYLVARVIRSRQGIDLSLINKEIPVE